MATITFDPAAFRVLFPQFADDTAFPTLRLDATFGLATGFIQSEVYGALGEGPRSYALQLMTAHLLAASVVQADNGYQGGAGVVTKAKVGDVDVMTATPPFGTSAWRYWLSLSPYGVLLLGLLDVQSAGGFYIGGLPERMAFRKVGGLF